MWEYEAREFLSADTGLLPFVPLMKGGLDLMVQAENRIYAEVKETEKRADLLASLAIFAGLKDAGMAKIFMERRRDLMIESPVYELIKQEGRQEGKQEGKQEGIFLGKLQTIKGFLENQVDWVSIKNSTGMCREEYERLVKEYIDKK